MVKKLSIELPNSRGEIYTFEYIGNIMHVYNGNEYVGCVTVDDILKIIRR